MNDQVREILLFAPELLGESLAAELPTESCPWQLKRSADDLSGHPALVIWSLPSDPTLVIVQREILQLQQRWAPHHCSWCCRPTSVLTLQNSWLELRRNCSGP